MTIKINPDFEKLIPPLSAEEFDQLEQNVIADGCREKIITWRQQIVDGHNRYKICNRNNIPFKTEERDFKDETEVKEWMIKNQFGRRNMSTYDRTLLALKLENVWKEKGLKNKQIAGGLKLNKDLPTLVKAPLTPVNTQEILSKIADVSKGTLHKVKYIEENASNDLKEKIRSNEMSINSAYLSTKHVNEKETKIDYNNSLERRIVHYPNIRHYKMHIANASNKLVSISEMSNDIQADYYDNLPAPEQNRLLAYFDKMTPEQIRNTRNQNKL